ncbi:MAG: hypothetical protein QM777_06545 [Pseudorhodoferax sp.]
MPPDIRQRVETELELIAFCKYEMFFLTVHDIVRHAREHKILCQGRGSAANSVAPSAIAWASRQPIRRFPTR